MPGSTVHPQHRKPEKKGRRRVVSSRRNRNLQRVRRPPLGFLVPAADGHPPLSGVDGGARLYGARLTDRFFRRSNSADTRGPLMSDDQDGRGQEREGKVGETTKDVADGDLLMRPRDGSRLYLNGSPGIKG